MAARVAVAEDAADLHQKAAAPGKDGMFRGEYTARVRRMQKS